MSRGPNEPRAKLLADLAGELRQLNGLSASYFRAAAARMGVTSTDMQVIENLAASGPTTAGQLADLTGLTTGAITGMLNRLEKAGLVRRERDPEDGRKVVVHLSAERDRLREIGPIFDIVGKAWEEMAGQYDDEQLALLVEFLKRGNAVARQEIAWLREAPEAQEGNWTAPLGELTGGQLIVAGSAMLTVRAGERMTALYEAHFVGPVPEVKAEDGVVTIRYPRRVWMLGAGRRAAEIALNTAIPWRVTIQGGGSEITAELGTLDLAGLEVKGGASMIHIALGAPSGTVPIRMSGGASAITVQRPRGVAARVHLKGWASAFSFDGQALYDVGNDVRMQSPDYAVSDQRYDISVESSASSVNITTE